MAKVLFYSVKNLRWHYIIGTFVNLLESRPSLQRLYDDTSYHPITTPSETSVSIASTIPPAQ